ncbi:MAG: hypothetical protein ACRCY5_07040 [Phocaeicola sp.]
MKSQNLVLPAAQASARKLPNPVVAINAWLNRENKLISALTEEKKTNKQVLLLTNLCFSFTLLLAFSYENPLVAFIPVAHLALSAYLCKKGGFNG